MKMKKKNFLLVILMVLPLLSFISCEKDDGSSFFSGAGSLRDWRYGEGQFEVYFNGVLDANITEIVVSSTPVPANSPQKDEWDFLTNLNIKGLVSKNKYIVVTVFSDIDSFEGTAEINGKTYSVNGEFTGDPFEHFTKQGIIVYFTSIENPQ